MLKRNISDSRRLSELKTDSARLLWTWIIPFLDSEGRFYASPEMIKGKVVPRIGSFTLKNIPTYLNDMARVGLITLYAVDGEKLLQYRKFEVFQNIVKSREAAPLPGPESTGVVTTDSRSNPDKVETESRPPVPNLREVNLKESSKALPTEEQPVDNSPPEPKKPDLSKTEKKGALQSANGRWTEPLRNDLEEVMNEIRDRYGPNYFQQCYLAVQTHLTHANPVALIYCLRELIQQNLKGNKVSRPKDWLNKAIHNQDGKINAQESEAEAQRWKEPLAPEALGVLNKLGMSEFGGAHG